MLARAAAATVVLATLGLLLVVGTANAAFISRGTPGVGGSGTNPAGEVTWQNGTAYVSWTDISGGDARVASWNGSGWTSYPVIGTAGGIRTDPSVAWDGSQLWAAFNDGSYEPRVKYYDGSAWNLITDPTVPNTGVWSFPNLAWDGTVLWLAWQDTSQTVRVSTWDGASWTSIASPGSGGGGNSYPNLEWNAATGTMWIAWNDAGTAKVAEYTGGSWVSRGSVGDGAGNKVPGITDINGTVLVSWDDDPNHEVRTFARVAGTWHEVDSHRPATSPNFSYPDLAWSGSTLWATVSDDQFSVSTLAFETDGAPLMPIMRQQLRDDDSTSIPAAGTTIDGVSTDVNLHFSLISTSGSQTATPWIEIRPWGTPFSAACGASVAGATFSGAAANLATAGAAVDATVPVTGLAAGTDYHWRACAKDGALVTAWAEDDAAQRFTVIQPPAPTLQFTDEANAQPGSANPLDIAAGAPHFSWINNATDTVDAQRVQVANSPTSGVAGMWHFDGDGTDSSGNGKDLTLAAPSEDPSFIGSMPGFGSAMNLDGNDYAIRAYDPDFSATRFTLDTWIRTGVAGTDQTIAHLSNTSTTNNFRFRLRSTGVPRIQFSIGGVLQQEDAAVARIDDNTWHHVAVAVDGPAGTADWVIDGVYVEQDTFPAGTIDQPAAAFEVGRQGASQFFTGDIDELRYSTVARSPAELVALYRSGLPPGTILWDSSPSDAGVALTSCSDSTRCADVTYGATGTPASLDMNDQRYYVRSKLRAQGGGPWSIWSTWDWFETDPIAGPDTQFADDTDASAGSANPTTITQDDLHLSWVNHAGQSVDRQRVQVVNTPLDDAIALWHLDGDATDATGNGHDGTIGTAPNDPAYSTTVRNSSFDQSLDFDGNDHLQIPTDPALEPGNDFTVDMWVRRPGRPAADEAMIEKGGNLNRHYLVYTGNNGKAAAIVSRAGADYYIDNPTKIDDGEWHHVALTVSASNQMNLYVDGISATSTVAVGGPVNGGLGASVYVGRYSSLAAAYFNGQIDELRIAGHAMTQAELRGYIATSRPHGTVMWDSDTGDTGVALGSACADAARCADVSYGATGSPTPLQYDGARYYARAKLKTQAGAGWSDWSGWDWFETQNSTSLSTAGCTGPARDLGSVLAGWPTVSSVDCSLTWGSAGTTTQLRMYQTDGGGVAAWSRPDGSPDTGFNGSGWKQVDDGGGEYIYSVSSYPGDRILYGGEHSNGSNFDATVTMLEADGTPVAGFGGGTVRFGATNDQTIQALAVLDDGKILAAGYTEWPPSSDFYVARLLPNGTLDPTFANGGELQYSITAGNDVVEDVLVLDDGSILLAGRGGSQFRILKLTPGGHVDTAFGTSGVASANFGAGQEEGARLLEQSDGKLLLVGQYINSTAPNVVARFTAAGALDTGTYGTGGKVTIANDAWEFNSFHHTGAVLQAGDKLVIGTEDWNGGSDLYLTRLDSSGNVDGSFGTASGSTTIDVFGNHDVGGTLVTDVAGDLMLAAAIDDGSGYRAASVRLSPDGVPDNAYGTNGVAMLPTGTIDPGEDKVAGTLLQDGRFAVAGSSDNGSDMDEGIGVFGTIRLDDYAIGVSDTNDGTSAFGACLRTSSGTATDWTVNASCPATDGAWWNPIPTSSGDAGSMIAHTTTAAPNASIGMRFLVRPPATASDGTMFYAPLTIEVVDPEL